MTEPKRKPERNRFIRKVTPWVVSIGILIYLLNKIPITEVYEASAGVNLWMFIPVIFFGVLIYVSWDVLVFKVLFNEIKIHVPYSGMFVTRAASLLLNMINHFIGAGSVAFLVHRWKKIPVSRTGSVVVFKMFIEYHAILALCLLTAFYIPGIDLHLFLEGSDEGNFVRLIVLSWAHFGVILAFFHLILPRTNGLVKIKNSNMLAMFRDVKPIKQLLYILMQATGFFLFDISIAFLLLLIFGLRVEFLYFIAFFPIVRLIEALPISVMGLGTSQMAMLWLLAPLIDQSTGDSTVAASIMAFSLLITILSNLSRFVIGSAGVRWLPEDVWESKGKKN